MLGGSRQGQGARAKDLSIQSLASFLLGVGHEVPVAVQGCRGRGVPQLALDKLDILALVDEERGDCVPQVVESDAPQPGPVQRQDPLDIGANRKTRSETLEAPVHVHGFGGLTQGLRGPPRPCEVVPVINRVEVSSVKEYMWPLLAPASGNEPGRGAKHRRGERKEGEWQRRTGVVRAGRRRSGSAGERIGEADSARGGQRRRVRCLGQACAEAGDKGAAYAVKRVAEAQNRRGQGKPGETTLSAD